MDVYLQLHVFGAVPIRKIDEILDLALLFYARALIDQTDGE